MYQKVLVLGNLGNEPVLRYTPQGDAVTSFSLATNRRWTNSEGQQFQHKILHHMRRIVDPPKKNSLTPQGNPCVCKHLTGASALWRNLPWVIDVNAHPEWVILPEHLSKRSGNPLRKNKGNP